MPGEVSRWPDNPWCNALWFQAVWLCAVLGRDAWLPLLASLLLAHLWWTRHDSGEWRRLLAVGGIGIVVDAVLNLAGVFEFPGGALVPLWLCGLWLGFAATLGRSLAWLGRHPVLVVTAGALAFPLNYWAGERLGAVAFGFPLTATLLVLALVWALLLPLLLRLTGWLATSPGGYRS